MLRLIEGGSGSGKSFWIKEQVRKLASEGKKILVVVPEQFSFETEREYYTTLGHKLMEQVETVSFLKLSDLIFREYGGLAGEYASDTAKRVIMRLAMKSCRDELRVYRKSAGSPELTDKLVSLWDELSSGGISPDDLREAALREKEGSLKEKLADLGLLYQSYKALLYQRYIDPADRLSKALELLKGRDYFAGKTVFFDEFKSFTAVQSGFLRQMMRECDEVYLSLCMEPMEEGKQLFSGIMETEAKVKALAARENRKVALPKRLAEAKRFSSSALSYFVSSLFRYQKEPFADENNSVFCGAFYNEFDESEYVAAKICHLVREYGWRFNDIAVLGRDMDQYGPILEAAFDKYGVPYFKDGAESIDTLPMIRFTARLLGLLSGKIRRDELLFLLKCGILDFTEQEISDFESYTYVWQVDGEELGKEFTKNPNGFGSAALSDRDLVLLQNAERVRDYLWQFVMRLRARVEEQNSIGKGLYLHFAEEGIIERQQMRLELLKEQNEIEAAEDEKRSWDGLVEILDTLESLLYLQKEKDELLSAAALREYKEMFAFSAAGYSLASRPQTIDSVLMGSAERVRVKDKKAVFLVGLNDGSFPLLPSEAGILSEKERISLIEGGMELASTFEQRLTDERYVAYLAAAVPSEQLYLSYAMGDLSGSEKQPSAVIEDFKAIFGKEMILWQRQIPPEFYCLSVSTTLLQYAKAQSDETKDVFRKSAMEVIGEYPAAAERLKKLREKGMMARFVLNDKQTAERLFTGTKEGKIYSLAPKTAPMRWRIISAEYREKKAGVVLSPSQIERYYSCSFQYFCRYGLGLQQRQKAELSPLSRGNVIHEFLRYALVREERNLPAKKLADEFLVYYLQKVMGGESGKTGRFLYFYNRLKNTLVSLLTALRQELSQSEFKVAGIEESIRKGGVIAPFTTVTADGREISVVGKVDRADRYIDPEEREFVRIIDYKSGGRQFDISAMAAGLNLQMLLYLFAIARTEKGKYKNARPAGILYMPAGNVRPELERDSDEEALLAAKTAGYKMNGMLLDDGRVLTAMEKDLAGKYIPISLGSKGYKGKYLCSPAEFILLEQKAEQLVTKMAESLLEGRIYPAPQKQSASQSGPCAYCEYKGLCGHESDDDIMVIEKINYDEFLAELKGGEQHA